MPEAKKPGIIDIHSHILPGIDDGARDFAESCQMLRIAAAQGISTVIATPHYFGRKGPPKLDEMEEAAEKIMEEIRREYPDFTICLGQETYYHEELPLRLKEGKAFTMAGSRYVLVEFDPMVPYMYLFRGIRELLCGGYRPILAHVERYRCLRREDFFWELKRSGCLLQMNYSSLEGNLLNPDVRWCRRQVLSGEIAFLGTDMHRIDFRPPAVSKALEWMGRYVEEDLLDAMTYQNPLRIIRDERI